MQSEVVIIIKKKWGTVIEIAVALFINFIGILVIYTIPVLEKHRNKLGGLILPIMLGIMLFATMAIHSKVENKPSIETLRKINNDMDTETKLEILEENINQASEALGWYLPHDLSHSIIEGDKYDDNYCSETKHTIYPREIEELDKKAKKKRKRSDVIEFKDNN